MPEKEEKSQKQNADNCPSVLDGPECIEGVPENKKSDKKQGTSRPGSGQCHSVLDGPECIEGIETDQEHR
jgi:hypothetical protein